MLCLWSTATASHAPITGNMVINTQQYYTVGHKKTCHFIWDHNSHVSWWIFTLLAPMETGKNTLSGNYKICNFYHNCVSTLPEKILKKNTQQNILNQLSVYFNAQCHQQQERVQANCFLASVLKMSTPSRTQAAKRSLHWSTALSMICCSSSLQMVSRHSKHSWRAMWCNYDVISDEEPLNK